MADGKPRFSNISKGGSAGLILDVAPAAGGWTLRPHGTTLKAASYRTKTEAIDAARAALGVKGGALRVRARNGQMQESVSLGRKAAAKISAVEGIPLDGDVRRELESFDRQGLSPIERRGRIGRNYGSGPKSSR